MQIKGSFLGTAIQHFIKSQTKKNFSRSKTVIHRVANGQLASPSIIKRSILLKNLLFSQIPQKFKYFSYSQNIPHAYRIYFSKCNKNYIKIIDTISEAFSPVLH